MTAVPLWSTALAGLLPANDSFDKCWWLSAKHSNSANLQLKLWITRLNLKILISKCTFLGKKLLNLKFCYLALRAIAGWLGSCVKFRYAALLSCSSITRACSNNCKWDVECHIWDQCLCYLCAKKYVQCWTLLFPHFVLTLITNVNIYLESSSQEFVLDF